MAGEMPIQFSEQSLFVCMNKFLLLPLAVLAGCASMKTSTPVVAPGQPTATVLVYREPAFNSGAVSMYFGEGDRYYLALRNGQYGELTLPAGSHRFLVTTQGSQDFFLDAELEANDRVCFKAFASPENYAKVIVPILMNLTSIFSLERVECPSDASLGGYKKVAAS